MEAEAAAEAAAAAEASGEAMLGSEVEVVEAERQDEDSDSSVSLVRGARPDSYFRAERARLTAAFHASIAGSGGADLDSSEEAVAADVSVDAPQLRSVVRRTQAGRGGGGVRRLQPRTAGRSRPRVARRVGGAPAGDRAVVSAGGGCGGAGAGARGGRAASHEEAPDANEASQAGGGVGGDGARDGAGARDGVVESVCEDVPDANEASRAGFGVDVDGAGAPEAGAAAASGGNVEVAAGAEVEAAATGTITLGDFLNRDKDDVRPTHLTPLTELLNLAVAHSDGVVGALGHNNRTKWIQDNTDFFFSRQGPLRAFKPVTAPVLARRIASVQTLARRFYDRHHSNDPSGANHEDLPRWVIIFRRLFVASDSQAAANQREARCRDDMRIAVRSLSGAQAPLGYRGDGAAPLRVETSRNNGARGMRQRDVGAHEVERVPVPAPLLEGADDVFELRPPPLRRGGTHRTPRRGSRVTSRNLHIQELEGPDSVARGSPTDDPSTRHSWVRETQSSISCLASMVGHWHESPLPAPPRPSRELIDVTRDFLEVQRETTTARARNDITALEFLSSVSQTLLEERNQIQARVTPSRRSSPSGGNSDGSDEHDDGGVA